MEDNLLNEIPEILERDQLPELEEAEKKVRKALELETYHYRKLEDKFGMLKFKFIVKFVLYIMFCIIWKLLYFDVRNVHGMKSQTYFIGTIYIFIFILPTMFFMIRDLMNIFQSSSIKWWRDNAKQQGKYSIALEKESSDERMKEYAGLLDQIRGRIGGLEPKTEHSPSEEMISFDVIEEDM